MRHRPSTSEMNISIGTKTFMVSEKILKSGVAQLTGATDISGNCLVTFPGSAVSQLDATNAEDLASLLRFYYSLLKCADKVRGMSVLANLQQASTPGISVWLKALEILQKERPGVIAIIYVIKPKNKDKSRQLKKQLGLKVKKSTLGDSLFKVAWLKNIQEVYNHIDPSQLTEDYGGFLSYNHQAWFHFQMDIGSLLRNARELEARIPSSKDQILLLQEYDVADLTLKELDGLLQQLEGKYHEIMQNLNLEETIDKCRYAIQNLEQPENDLVLAQISSVVLFTTKVDLNHLYNYFVTTKKELAQIWQEVNFIIQKFRQFHICKEKANQLCLEIAEQYNLRIEQHPIVGKTLNEAQICSLHFESSLYKPAKELLTRATEILEEMHEIQLPKLPSDDESDPGFLAEFTSTIQLFAETLDNIYKQYTNIHLFYLVFEKCLVWYQKVLHFLPLSLNKLLISVQEPPSTASSSSSTSSSGSVDRPQQNKIELIPSDWPKLVGTIHTKYPGPKKEHLAILNSAAPPNIDCDARGHSALLAHRIQLLSAVLQKNLFRRHQLQKAMQWKDSLIEGDDNIVSYYLALNSSFPQVQKKPSEILQFSTEEEEKAEDSDESPPHQRSISPRQYHRENHENPQLVPSQEEINDPSNVQNNPSEMDNQKSSDNDKEYFVSLSLCDSDVQPLSFLSQSEEIKKRSTQPPSNISILSQQTNVKYMKSTGTKLRKDRKHGRNQQLKKSKKTSLPSFPQSRHFPSTYNEFDDEEQGLFQAQKEYVLPVNWLQKGKNSNGTIIREIKRVTSSQLPNDEKVNLVQSLLSMLHLQSPTDTSTDSTHLMSLQETRHHRPRFNSLSSGSVSGVVPRTTASLPHKHHHHHHQQHPRTARSKNRKASLMDSKGKLSGISRWNMAEQTSLVSSNPMMCSCIQFNCGHNNSNMLRLHGDYLSHSMHNLGRDEVIYDKLSDTVSLTKDHDSYPNLHHPENLLANSTCRDYSNPSYIPSQFVHRPHVSSCPGHPPSPMAVSPGRSMNYVDEWMNCSGAADGLAEDLNTVSLYSPTWDKSETQEFEDVDEITKDLSFDCQLYEQQQEDIRSSLQRTEKILLEQEQLLYSHMMPEEDPEQLTDEILSHLSTDSAYVGDSEHLCPSVLSSNIVQVSSPSSDYDFVGQNSNSPDLLETAYREMDFYDAATLGDSIQDERQWSSEEETEIEARSLSDLAEELDTNSSDVNGKNSEESGASPIQLQNYPESSSSSSSKISKAEVRSKTEKHHSKTTPVKLSIFQTNSTSEADVEEFY